MSSILGSKINLANNKSGKQSIASILEQKNLSDEDLRVLKDEYLHNNFMRVKMDQFFLKSMKTGGESTNPKENSGETFISLNDLRSNIQHISNENVKKLMRMIVSEN